ncbi:MAG: helix-turn-helix domain-containing protein [Thermoplasmata archaeon]|nr:helix-turn-helix domain-containing protein [Thermoplasmata archaeon]
MFQDIELIVIQQQFTTSPKDFILLCDITWKEKLEPPGKALANLTNLKDQIKYIDDIVLIQSDLKRKRSLCFIKGIHDPAYTELFSYTTKEFLCFIEYPLLIREVFGVVNLVGLPRDVDRLIEFMKEFGSDFEVVAVKNYWARDRGILSVLTDKQITVLKQAYDRGFFDFPRKKPARDISKKIGIAHTTFLTHIRKSQNRIFSALFED